MTFFSRSIPEPPPHANTVNKAAEKIWAAIQDALEHDTGFKRKDEAMEYFRFVVNEAITRISEQVCNQVIQEAHEDKRRATHVEQIRFNEGEVFAVQKVQRLLNRDSYKC